MGERTYRLEVWVRYDSSDGYVWPTVYGTEKEAHLDEKLNYPIKIMKLVSEPYFTGKLRITSFGTKIALDDAGKREG